MIAWIQNDKNIKTYNSTSKNIWKSHLNNCYIELIYKITGWILSSKGALISFVYFCWNCQLNTSGVLLFYLLLFLILVLLLLFRIQVMLQTLLCWIQKHVSTVLVFHTALPFIFPYISNRFILNKLTRAVIPTHPSLKIHSQHNLHDNPVNSVFDKRVIKADLISWSSCIRSILPTVKNLYVLIFIENVSLSIM